MIFGESVALDWAPQHSEEWHRVRAQSVTATDVPALLGCFPASYKDADAAGVLRKKQPGYVRPKPSYAMRRGIELEPQLLAYYEKETGAITEHSPPLLRSKEWPWLVASIDAFAYHRDESDPWLVECKTSAVVEPGAVPASWSAQVQAQLLVTGWARADIVAKNTRTGDFWITRIDRDQKWLDQLVPFLADWAAEHLTRGQIVRASGEESNDG